MKEITIGLAESYFRDRIIELRNHELSAGTPFIFISLITILKTLKSSARMSGEGFMEEFMGYKPEDALKIFKALDKLSYTFSMMPQGGRPSEISLSHTENHLSVDENNRLVVNARTFLEDVDMGLTNLFKRAEKDNKLRVTIYAFFNKNKMVGYGD